MNNPFRRRRPNHQVTVSVPYHTVPISMDPAVLDRVEDDCQALVLALDNTLRQIGLRPKHTSVAALNQRLVAVAEIHIEPDEAIQVANAVESNIGRDQLAVQVRSI